MKTTMALNRPCSRGKYIMAMIAMTLVICSEGLSVVFLPSDFFSFYEVLQTYGYTDSNGQYQEQLRSGYYNLYNLDDPIVRCNQEGGTCPYYAQYTLGFTISVYKQLFKVYVPPGTTGLNFTIMLSQPAEFIVAARLGVPPQNDYSIYAPSASEYNALPTRGFSIAQLKQGDCVGRNSSGLLNVAKDAETFVATESDGGWLYVMLMPKQGYVTNNSYSNTIHTESYLAWFRNVNWDTFDSPGVIVSPTPTPIPTPTPMPTPTPTPAPDDCPFGCNNDEHCENGQCVKNSPTPTPTPSPAPAVCTSTVDGNLLLHIPYLSYVDPTAGAISFWADFVYEFNPTFQTVIFFKLANAGSMPNLSLSCAISTLSGDFKIHIPDVLFPDGITHLWLDLEYSPTLSSQTNAYFFVTNYGVF